MLLPIIVTTLLPNVLTTLLPSILTTLLPNILTTLLGHCLPLNIHAFTTLLAHCLPVYHPSKKSSNHGSRNKRSVVGDGVFGSKEIGQRGIKEGGRRVSLRDGVIWAVVLMLVASNFQNHLISGRILIIAGILFIFILLFYLIKICTC